jgi:hypothetical protein
LKLHHVLADGPAVMAGFAALLDQIADASGHGAPPWTPAPSRPPVNCCATTCDAASPALIYSQPFPRITSLAVAPASKHGEGRRNS